MRHYLRLLIAAFALGLNSPSYANFAMSPSGSTTAFAIDAANQGTALCAASVTECPASVLINTAGAPIGVAATPMQVSIANTGANGTAVKVDGSGATQPVSAASLPLPTGAATSALQTTGNTTLTTINTTLGSPFQAGAALAANQSVNVNQMGGTGISASCVSNYGTAPGAVACPSVNANVTNSTQALVANVDGVTPAASALNSPVNNYNYLYNGTTFDRARSGTTTGSFLINGAGTLGTPAGGVLTVQGGASMTKLLVTPDSVALPANQSVNVAQFGGTSTATGQVAVSVAPVTATNTALVVDLRPDSPGIISLGVAADTSSVPVVASPSGNATAGVAPVVCGSAVSSCVLKASAGNLYAAYADCTSACWLMLFNATSAPSNGATTAGIAANNMTECVPIAAGGVGGVSYSVFPAVYTTGMTAAVSSTACGTLTLSTVGFVHGLVK